MIMIESLFERIGKKTASWVDEFDPFTNVYGVGRSLIALSTLLTLVFTRTDVLFRPAAGVEDFPVCVGVRAAGAYCIAGTAHLELVRWLSVVVLLLVIAGWRPRITGILHAWVAYSFHANAITVEGGDQVAGIVSLLLVPVTLLDDRKSHWIPRATKPSNVNPERERMIRLVARICFTLIRLQVAGIYFHASIAKFAVDEWTNGTVLWYWLMHPTFGVAEWMQPVAKPLLLNGVVVALTTWSVLLVEWALSAGLLVAKKHWAKLLLCGIALHFGIACLHGLVSFAITMFGALVLYLRPLEQPFDFRFVTVRIADLIASIHVRKPLRSKLALLRIRA